MADRKIEYKTIDGKKCCRYEGTTTWQICNVEDKK